MGFLLAAYQFAGTWFAFWLAIGVGGTLLAAGWRLRPARASSAMGQEVAP